MKPHVVFWLVAGLNGLLLVFLTPPFEVHDEFQHFFRTYQLSEGTLWGVVQAGRVGGVLPTSLAELVLRTWGTLGIWTVPPTHVHPLGQTWSEFSLPLQPSLRAFADFSGAASYSPLPYAPQATAIALGRWLECPPLALLYAGRVANAAASISLVAWAIRILPSGRDVALVIALLPMAQYEYSSVAPDGLIIATAFLFTALSLEAAQCGRWVAWKAIVAAIAAAVFCSIKPPYAPLLLLSFLPACGVKAVMSYEEGYEPYRRIPNLWFCEHLFAANLRATIEKALRAPLQRVVDDPDFGITPAEWVGRIYAGILA